MTDFYRGEDLLVRTHHGSELLYIRSDSQEKAWSALGAWVEEYKFHVYAAQCSYRRDGKYELFAVYSRD